LSQSRWSTRKVAPELVERYLAEGWWTDETLGQMVEKGLAGQRDVEFHVHSAVRPWSGTFGEVDDRARELAAWLAGRGVGPGSVFLMQLPNWVEAGISFWAAAYLGAVVVPVVHFYGPKEVRYIIDAVDPDVVVTVDRFGTADHLATYPELLAGRTVTTWLVVGDDDSDLPAGATPFGEALGRSRLDGVLEADPDSPAIIAFTSGTTRDPKGVIHSHRTIGFETRQLDGMFPKGGPPQITGAPVGHFIGMVNAFLVPLLRNRPVNLVDVWNPTDVLRLMDERGLGLTGGATYFVTSLLDHPDFADRHLALMPFAGLGGSPVPIAVMERLHSLGIDAFRSYGSTEHPSITGCSLADPVDKRNSTDGYALAGVEIRLTEDGEILSRGPDCFVGYVDPALTDAVFDEEGWYHTGDIGILDDEGYLAITDRISDVIIRGGENISAQEVEELLIQLDGVAEVAVVAAPDERFGERAAAVFRMVEGARAPDLDSVRTHQDAAGLARQKWPELLHLVPEFPRTASGKVQKFRLREELRAGRLVPYDPSRSIGTKS
jgi:acyl-CoA synthetase